MVVSFFAVVEAMEEQSVAEEQITETQTNEANEDTVSKNQSQQDSAYGSLECSSQGQSNERYLFKKKVHLLIFILKSWVAHYKT